MRETTLHQPSISTPPLQGHTMLRISKPAAGRAEALLHTPAHPACKLWIECDGGLPDDPVAVADCFFLGVLPAAMRIGLPLHIDIPVSSELIEGAAAWQAGMARSHPERLQEVEIVSAACPSGSHPATRRRQGALACFSGGVDSSFTAMQLARLSGSGRLAAGLLVHGFDIEKNDTAGFRNAVERARLMLDSLGAVRLRILRTNLRDICHKFDVDWGSQVHGAQLAAVLHLFRGAHSAGYIPATYPIGSLKDPWGSHPALDSLLGSPEFPIHHHGSSFDRREKVLALAAWEAARTWMRVCWEGAASEGNCGRCFKCVATQCCFLAATGTIPPAFHTPLTPGDLLKTHLRDRQNFDLLARVSEQCRRFHPDTWWTAELGELIHTHRPRLAPETLAMAQLLAIALDWLDGFADCVRRRDFEKGSTFCEPQIHGFGTIADEARGIESLARDQWQFIWPRTSGFHFLKESMQVRHAPDCRTLVVTAAWNSDGLAQKSKRIFHRSGRATIVLLQQPDGRFLATHTHFSLTPSHNNAEQAFL